MHVECFGESRPQEGRLQTLKQDAFLIGRRPVAWVALCDGAGSAQSVAKRALGRPAVLDAAAQRGRADDMTAVALRLVLR